MVLEHFHLQRQHHRRHHHLNDKHLYHRNFHIAKIQQVVVVMIELKNLLLFQDLWDLYFDY
jgi:hypothetical protein